MPDWEYRAVQWDKSQEQEPGEIIEAETKDNNWDFHASVNIHPGRADLVFRRDTQNQ